MSSDSIKVAPTYFPVSNIEFVLSELHSDDSKKDNKESNMTDNDKTLVVKAGLAKGWTKNKQLRS